MIDGEDTFSEMPGTDWRRGLEQIQDRGIANEDNLDLSRTIHHKLQANCESLKVRSKMGLSIGDMPSCKEDIEVRP